MPELTWFFLSQCIYLHHETEKPGAAGELRVGATKVIKLPGEAENSEQELHLWFMQKNKPKESSFKT